MSKAKILIVEDEILIADMIARYLRKEEYEVVGIAISFEEAVKCLNDFRPDIVLLDIRINGSKTGIDVAHYINQHSKVPFIFLTSQIDELTVEEAKQSFPAGYLAKPVVKESLFTMIEICLNNSKHAKSKDVILLKKRDASISVPVDTITYVKADHVYLQIFFEDGSNTLVRDTLKSIINELPKNNFVQTHRSFIVNKKHISRLESNVCIVGEIKVPVSRNRRKKVQEIFLN